MMAQFVRVLLNENFQNNIIVVEQKINNYSVHQLMMDGFIFPLAIVFSFLTSNCRKTLHGYIINNNNNNTPDPRQADAQS